MEEAGVLGASRHGCKVCGKSFPCGRSLGGHMRSHLSLNSPSSTDTRPVVDTDVGADRASGGGGYGLRENPKKTRRVSDFGGEVFGHVRRHASGGRGREDVGVVVKMEELEAEAKEKEEEMLMPSEATAVLAVAAAQRRRRRSMRVAAPAPAPATSPQSVLTGLEKEQEEVALCLLMLSRDTGSWQPSAIPAVKEEPLEDGNSARNGYSDGDSDDYSALLQHGNAKINKNKKRTSSSFAGDKRGRYVCPGCGKAFLSYQALGGHRASHKRINISCSITNVAPDHSKPSLETNASISSPPMSVSPDVDAAAIGHMCTGNVEKFECPICYKVFASGQALGGHKRSHLIADHELYAHANGNGNACIKPQQSFTTAGFLDLNLPASGDED